VSLADFFCDDAQRLARVIRESGVKAE